MSTSLSAAEVIAEDLPNHEQQLATYVAAGLERRTAFDLEIRAARIITRGRRAIIETGQDLLAARQSAQYGTWGPFLTRCGIEERTAQNYMRVAEQFADKPEIISGLPVSALYALAAPSADPARVGEIVSEVEAGATFTAAEVRERLAPFEPPMDYAIWQKRAAAVGATLAIDEQRREYVISREGQRPVSSAQWANVTSFIAGLEPPPADVAPEDETPAERYLLAAQNASPGTQARGEQLIQAKAAIRMVDDTELREALVVRWRTLHSEHEQAMIAAANAPAEQEIAAAPARPTPPAIADLAVPPRPALPPALPGLTALPQVIEARKVLACKRAILAAALALVEEQLAAVPGPTVVVRDDAAREQARFFVNNPAVSSAAAMLGFSATVESEAA